MHFKKLILCLSVVLIAHAAFAIELDTFGSLGGGLYAKKLTCGSSAISFTRKIKNQAPDFLINGTKIPLTQSCFSNITCINKNGEESALLMVDDACGGNAVPPYYLMINLKSLKTKQISYQSAIKTKLVSQ